MTRLLLLSDTHLPKRARDLPAEVWQAVDVADVVFHAGDWVDLETWERLTARVEAAGGRFVGVWGNNDGPELRAVLPEVARVDVAGLRFSMTHETGPATGRELRADAAFPGVDVLVFGHSHIPWDSVTPAGLRLLNPGSPTDRRRQPHCTYLTATVVAAAPAAAASSTVAPPGPPATLTDVTLHRLAPTRMR